MVPGDYFFPGLDKPWPHTHQCMRMNYVPDPQKIEAGCKSSPKRLSGPGAKRTRNACSQSVTPTSYGLPDGGPYRPAKAYWCRYPGLSHAYIASAIRRRRCALSRSSSAPSRQRNA